MAENYVQVLVEKVEGKRPLGRPRCRWEDNMNMLVTEIEREEVNWLYMAQDREISLRANELLAFEDDYSQRS
jgi:hypothetical protein